MTNGAIWRQLVEFSVPMLIGLLFQQLYNTVDAAVVGRYVGKAALAAVGGSGTIINTLVGLCAGFATGAGVVISQSYGRHDDKQLHDAVHTAVSVTFIIGVLATAVGIFIVDPMLVFMKTPADVIPQSREYLRIYFAGVSGLLVYNLGAGILRAVGDSRRPLYFLCFSALTNIVLDLVFVLVLDKGIAGVAYATIISQFLSAVLVMITLSVSKEPFGLKWRKLRIRKEMLIRIMQIGLPSGLQAAITAFSNVFVMSYINGFGSACMAGWSSYTKLDIFVTIPIQSIGLATTTFVGQNYGAHKLSRARAGVRQAMLVSLGITAVLVTAMLIFHRPLLMLFTDESDVMYYGTYFLMLVTPFYITSPFNQILPGALRGIGNARTPTIILLSSFVVFRQIYLFVNRLLGGGLLWVTLSFPAAWILSSVLLYVYYRRSVICWPDAGSTPSRVSDSAPAAAGSDAVATSAEAGSVSDVAPDDCRP